jgi:hypothetical protein
MSIPNIDLIDSAFINVKQKIREEIEAYLEDLSIEEKRDYVLLVIKPSIPSTPEKRHEIFSAWINLYNEVTVENFHELKNELIGLCESFGLNTNPNLPLRDFQNEMMQAFEQSDNEHLLKVGVFGTEVTQDDVNERKEMIISSYTMQIFQVAYDELLQEEGRKVSPDYNRESSIAVNKFPNLIRLAKENFKRKNLLN